MNVHFKTIYCVSQDYACKYEGGTEIKACFEDKAVAIEYMNSLWERERIDSNNFEKYDTIDEREMIKEAYIDGEWYDTHFCLEVAETRLYK